MKKSSPDRCTNTITIEQAKAWWARKGPKAVMRARALTAKGGTWSRKRARQGAVPEPGITLTDRDGDNHYIVCSQGTIVSYFDPIQK